MKNRDCEKLPKGRLCSLAKDMKLKKIEKLSIEPRFICTKCARVAHCAKSLCKPQDM